MKIIIPNIKKLEELKIEIKKAGHKNLHILSDFDRTLTYGAIGEVKTPSIISMLRDGKHLTEGYAEKANALFEKYHPIEINLKIPLDKRRRAMQEWWETHNELLINSGLTKSDLVDIVQKGHIKFRKGVSEFIDLLYEYNIPFIILSASGCGEAIQLFFQKIGKDYSNIFYVINRFNWDENGRAISPRGPMIHCLNKSEIILEKIPEIYRAIKNRKNVILLGDSIDDLDMIEGFNYNNLLKIGFLNFDYEKLREDYKKNFDVILEGDGDFNFVNDLIQNLFNKNR
jgi:5'-nucleotidase